MKKTINVEATYAGMRIDRFLRKHFDNIPQSLIEKNLRSGKIKLNKKKIKSSAKLKINDLIELTPAIMPPITVQYKIDIGNDCK